MKTEHPYAYKVVVSADPGEDFASFNSLISSLAEKSVAVKDFPGPRKIHIVIALAAKPSPEQVEKVGEAARDFINGHNPQWKAEVVSVEELTMVAEI